MSPHHHFHRSFKSLYSFHDLSFIIASILSLFWLALPFIFLISILSALINCVRSLTNQSSDNSWPVYTLSLASSGDHRFIVLVFLTWPNSSFKTNRQD